MTTTWHDLKRNSDKLFIQGFARLTRHLSPQGNPDYDGWGLNEEYNYDWVQGQTEDGKPDPSTLKHPYSLWFQMHPRWDFTRDNNMNHYNHPNWLLNKSGACILCKGAGELEKKDKTKVACSECKGSGNYTPPTYRADLPIIMQKRYADIPNSISFPLEEATDLFGLDYPYFTSSVAYMLVLAYLMGYKRVGMYGFSMGTDTEYHYQRANIEFIIGFLKAKGMDIYLPPESSILRGDLYGYKNMKTGFRQNLELRKEFLKTQEVSASVKSQQAYGQVLLLQEILAQKGEVDLQKLLSEKAVAYDKAKGLHNVVKGAGAEVGNMSGLFDKYYMTGAEDHIPSMEGFAQFTNAEYDNGNTN